MREALDRLWLYFYRFGIYMDGGPIRRQVFYFSMVIAGGLVIYWLLIKPFIFLHHIILGFPGDEGEKLISGLLMALLIWLVIVGINTLYRRLFK